MEILTMNQKHRGGNFDDFLMEEGLYAEVQALAVKKLFALKMAELMKKEKLTKDQLAKRMKTSRAALDRLLDPTNPSVTLVTLGKAACALGRTLRVELIEAER
jgi:predicted DNA-binding protein (UPF0251 family)